MSTPSPTVSPAPGSSTPATNGTSPPPASPSPPPGNGTSPLPSPTVPAPPPSPTVPAPPPPVAATPPSTSSPPPPPDAATPPSSNTPPSPPPPDAGPSPPSPPGSTSPPTTPSPPGSTSPPTTPSPPSPPSSGSSRPPPSPGSISPPSPSNSVSTGVVVGAVIAGVIVLVVGVIIFCCFRKKKKKSDLPESVYAPPPPPPPHKGDPYGRGQNLWPYNAPPPADNVGKIPPRLPPPPAYGSRPPHSPPVGPSPQSSLPPPPAITSSGGSSSNYSGSDAPLPPLSPGLVLGFSKNTFSLEELAMATDGFSDANLLGQGAFGYVHKGILPNGKEVAIKQLKAGSWQGEREFQAEVDIISRVHHRHLVSLVGYCSAGGQKMLVYEFVPNKTLEFHLHGKGRPTLEWSVRQKIALGAAKGLAYLHEDCHPKIIHRDIKAANILLDYNFEAKVADFGLAKDAPDANTHWSTRVMGTFGYLAPEYASTGKVSYKSDVFSFGVMLLELITGRRPVNSRPSHEDDSLVNWAMPLLARAMEEGKYDHLVDPKLQNDYDHDEMARMVACAAGSVRHLARRRPRMSQIVRTLEGGVSLDSLKDDGGIHPGHSRIDRSSDYDSSSQQYNTFQRNEDIKRHYQLAFDSQDHGSSEYVGAASEFGLNPSTSSSEGQQTREIEMGRATQD